MLVKGAPAVIAATEWCKLYQAKLDYGLNIIAWNDKSAEYSIYGYDHAAHFIFNGLWIDCLYL